MSTRAAIYLRVSRDFTGNQVAVTRQREDCARLAEERGWTIAEEYVDNSLSASRKTGTRPAYDRMVRDFAEGKFDALVCWDLDRLTRQPRQLEDWIDAAEERGLVLVTANGEADLSTDGGRLFARIKASVARAEVERKGARQRRANEQRARAGEPWRGGPRAFGYTQDRAKIIEPEAALIRSAAREVPAGRPLRQVAEEWHESGLWSSHGHHSKKGWTGRGVRSVLVNPLYAGIRTHRGQEVARGEWPAILSLEEHLELVHTLSDPARQRGGVKTGTRPTTLLTGIARCGKCNGQVRGSSSRGRLDYACRGDYCSRAPREEADAWVLGALVGALESERLSGTATGSDQLVTELEAEKEAASRRLDMAVEAYMAGQVSQDFISRLETRTAARLTELEEQLAAASTASRTAAVLQADDIRAMVEGLSLYGQRELVSEHLDVRLLPRGSSRRAFDPEIHMAVEKAHS